MTFMHFDATIAAAAEPVITLSSGTVNAHSGTDDGRYLTTATAGWVVSGRTGGGLDKGDMQSWKTEYGGGAFYYTPKENEWNSDKDFTSVFWVKGMHYDNDTPNTGNALDVWYPLYPDWSAVSWGWSCTSKFFCTRGGSIVISIARNESSVITSDHTSLDFDGQTITRTGGTSFLTQGFAVDQIIRIENSENGGENDTVIGAQITNVTSTVITTTSFWTTNTFDTTATLEKYGALGTTIASGLYTANAQVDT